MGEKTPAHGAAEHPQVPPRAAHERQERAPKTGQQGQQKKGGAYSRTAHPPLKLEQKKLFAPLPSFCCFLISGGFSPTAGFTEATTSYAQCHPSNTMRGLRRCSCLEFCTTWLHFVRSVPSNAMDEYLSVG